MTEPGERGSAGTNGPMKPRGRVLLILAAVVVGALLPFAQATMSPAAYDIVWGTFIFVAGLAIVASFVVPQLIGGERKALVSTREKNPEGDVELAAVWTRSMAPISASVVVGNTGVSIESVGGFFRELAWPEITGFTSVQYGQTYRVGMELASDSGSICIMPISSITHLPVSLARAERFFDAMKRCGGCLEQPADSS